MYRSFATLAVALAFTAGFTPESSAQVVQSTSEFKVVRGTTLWDLAKQTTGNGENWHSIFDANVAAGILDSTDMSVASGDTVVWLRPGDTILLRADAAIRAPEALEKVDTAQAVVPPVAPAVPESSSGVSWWWLALLIMIAGALAYRNWKYRGQVSDLKQESAARNRASMEYQSRLGRTERWLQEADARVAEAERPREPAETFTDLEVRGLATGYRRQRTEAEGEGPSFIAGGISSPETLTLALQRAAQIEGVRRSPDTPVVPHTQYVFRRGRRGRVVSGTYSSLFSDGTERVRVVERDKPETYRIVWKATAVAPDGTEFDTYAEEVCANGMAIPVNAQAPIVWEELPEAEQIHALPQSAIYTEPTPPAPTPTPVVVEMVTVVAVTTPDGRVIHVPAGSTMAPVQIPASEMISPAQGSETATT